MMTIPHGEVKAGKQMRKDSENNRYYVQIFLNELCGSDSASILNGGSSLKLKCNLC